MHPLRIQTVKSRAGFAPAAISVLLIMCTTLCSTEKAEKPSVSLHVSSNMVSVNTVVTFTLTGKADFMTIWTGDLLHNFEAYLASTTNCDNTPGTIVKPADSGEVIKRNTYSYQYKIPGTYKVVVLASNVGEFGENIEVQKIEHTITVQ